MSNPTLKMLANLRGVILKLRKSNVAANLPIVSARSYWRRNALSELSSAMQMIENRMRDMDKEMNRLFEGVQRSSPVKFPGVFGALDLNVPRAIPVVSTDGDGRNYRLELEMEGMKPENISVTLKNHELTVTAKIDEKKSDGSRLVRENTYHYTLPEEVNPDMIRSSLSNGMLVIEAPLPALESKEIPVKIEGSSENSESKKK